MEIVKKIQSMYNMKSDNLAVMRPMTKATASCLSCLFKAFCESANMVKKQHTLKRNEILCVPNQKFYSLYAIESGALKTYQINGDGNEIIKGFYFAGEVLGYEAIYTQNYPYSVAALSETKICEIPYNHFLTEIQHHPFLQQQILHLISQQLNAGAYLSLNAAEQRIVAFLLDLCHRLHIDSHEFRIPMTREDMGNYLRLTAETISRVLSRLNQQKIISINQKKIRILNMDYLKRVAQ